MLISRTFILIFKILRRARILIRKVNILFIY